MPVSSRTALRGNFESLLVINLSRVASLQWWVSWLVFLKCLETIDCWNYYEPKHPLPFQNPWIHEFWKIWKNRVWSTSPSLVQPSCHNILLSFHRDKTHTHHHHCLGPTSSPVAATFELHPWWDKTQTIIAEWWFLPLAPLFQYPPHFNCIASRRLEPSHARASLASLCVRLDVARKWEGESGQSWWGNVA